MLKKEKKINNKLKEDGKKGLHSRADHQLREVELYCNQAKLVRYVKITESNPRDSLIIRFDDPFLKRAVYRNADDVLHK